MKTEAWQSIITSVGLASSSFINSKSESLKQDSQLTQSGFKCLKHIISNNMQELGQENIIQVFGCIEQFALQTIDNINLNLISIGMFMNVADYVAKLTKGLDNRDSNLSLRKK